MIIGGGHEELAIRALVELGGGEFKSAGITRAHFRDGVMGEMFEWAMERYTSRTGLTPAGMEARFSSYKHESATEEDMSVAIDLLVDAKLRRDVGLAIQQYTVDKLPRAEVIAPLVLELAGKLAEMASVSIKSPLIDGFSKDGAAGLCLEGLRQLKKGYTAGLPTGLPRFDRVAGGLRPGELISIIGRTGKGKSWIGVEIIASAIAYGAKVLYYPLEMGVEAIMYRLHPFLAREMGVSLSNKALTHGWADDRVYGDFLEALHKKHGGQLKVLDMSATRAEYTPSRVDADVEREKPGLIVVDYLTLLRPEGMKNAEDYQIIKRLSSDLKLIAMRYQVPVVVVAQVNRAAIRSSDDTLLPRLEHISFGDALGADSDKVISINKVTSRSDTLYYGLVKNRAGEEFDRTALRFNVDEGELFEVEPLRPEADIEKKREQDAFGDKLLYDEEETDAGTAD